MSVGTHGRTLPILHPTLHALSSCCHTTTNSDHWKPSYLADSHHPGTPLLGSMPRRAFDKYRTRLRQCPTSTPRPRATCANHYNLSSNKQQQTTQANTLHIHPGSKAQAYTISSLDDACTCTIHL